MGRYQKSRTVAWWFVNSTLAIFVLILGSILEHIILSIGLEEPSFKIMTTTAAVYMIVYLLFWLPYWLIWRIKFNKNPEVRLAVELCKKYNSDSLTPEEVQKFLNLKSKGIVEIKLKVIKSKLRYYAQLSAIVLEDYK